MRAPVFSFRSSAARSVPVTLWEGLAVIETVFSGHGVNFSDPTLDFSPPSIRAWREAKNFAAKPFCITLTCVLVFVLFRVQDKDEFQDYYRKHLMRRLLLKSSSYNEDREQTMIKKLQVWR